MILQYKKQEKNQMVQKLFAFYSVTWARLIAKQAHITTNECIWSCMTEPLSES